MSKKPRFMQPLKSSLHLYTAMAERLSVVVFNGDILIGSGHINEVTEVSVRIGDERFLRETCTFKYAN